MHIKWIAADWGTTNLRVWGIDAHSNVVCHAESSDGMGNLKNADDYESALLSIISPWLDRRQGKYGYTIYACGMVGAREGWVHAPYLDLSHFDKVNHLAERLVKAPVKDSRFQVFITPGVKRDLPADVMRGEETQLLGFLETEPSYSGLVCLPGTHSKWVRFQDGRLKDFQTYMTGELYSLIKDKSILRHTLTGKGDKSAAFDLAVEEAFDSPARVLEALFELRAGAMVGSLDLSASGSRLSGLLLGAELNAVLMRFDLKSVRDIAIIGTSNLASFYQRALELCGFRTVPHLADKFSLAGLTAIRHAHLSTQSSEEKAGEIAHG